MYISPKQAAEKYGLKLDRIYKAIKRGAINARRELGLIYIEEEDLKKALGINQLTAPIAQDEPQHQC